MFLASARGPDSMAAVRHDWRPQHASADPPNRGTSNRGRRPPFRAIPARVALLLALGSAACGDDVSLSVRFSSGTVSETAQCSGGRGQFPLRQQDGLSVTILITDDTTIVRANFTPATCGDLVKGERVSVRGADDDGRIRANEVELLDS
jgi:hypothetical protein